MCAPDAPPAPDYAGAATAQGEANIEAARASARLNNPNIINPYGTQTTIYGVGDDPDQATLIQQFSPEQQGLYDRQVAMRTALGDVGITGANSLGGIIGRGLDLSGMGAQPEALQQDWSLNVANSPEALNARNLSAMPGNAQQTRNNVVNAMMSRVDQDTAGQRDAKRSELVAQGIRPGTAAYDSAMGQIDRQYNDARQQAILNAGQEAQRDFGMDMGRRTQGAAEQAQQYGQQLGGAGQNFQQRLAALQQYQSAQGQGYSQADTARRQQIAEALMQRQTPLNEITALMSGSQVSNPFAGNMGYQAGSNVAPAPIFQATQAQGAADMNAYNAQQAGTNSMLSGLFGLGSAAIMAPRGTFSDRRLKRNIKRIGTHPLGIGRYEWDYVWGEHSTGVMADEVREVMPAAISQICGYDAVDYAMIGGR